MFRASDHCGVGMIVPLLNYRKNFFYVEGSISNCEIAKEALLKRIKELEDESKERALRGHSETMQFYPSHISGNINCCDTFTKVLQ